MEKISCRLCGSWLVYEAPHTGDEAVAEHRRVNHPVTGHAATVIERDRDTLQLEGAKRALAYLESQMTDNPPPSVLIRHDALRKRIAHLTR